MTLLCVCEHEHDLCRFHAQMEPLIANVPYMIGIGNHERDWPDSGCKLEGDDSGGECGVAHERRFLMPSVKQDQPWCAAVLCCA